MGADWEATEERLEARSDERRGRLERSERRRRWLPWLLAPIVLPALGAAVVIAMVERAGGDLASWPLWQAIAAPAAAFVLPALLAAWFARRLGVVEAILWALACLGSQAALVFGVGLLALGYGPA